MSHLCEHHTGDEPRQGPLLPVAAHACACRELSGWEAALLARERTNALRRVQRAEPKLARLGERLVLAALAAAGPTPPAARGAGWARIGALPRLPVVIPRTTVRVTVRVTVCVTVALTAYLSVTGDGGGAGNLPLPTGLLVLVFLLGMVPVRATRPEQALVPPAVRRAHHRAWLALEAEVNRLLVACDRGIADAEARILHRRASHGQAIIVPPRQAATVAARPLPGRAAASPGGLLPPGVQLGLEPSLRLLKRYRPQHSPSELR